MGTRATPYFEIRSPEEKKTFKMNQKVLTVFVVILALSLIVAEAAPQWRRVRYRNRGFGGFGGGNARQTLKTIGGKKNYWWTRTESIWCSNWRSRHLQPWKNNYWFRSGQNTWSPSF